LNEWNNNQLKIGDGEATETVAGNSFAVASHQEDRKIVCNQIGSDPEGPDEIIGCNVL
jgi:hypothetical protein